MCSMVKARMDGSDLDCMRSFEWNNYLCDIKSNALSHQLIAVRAELTTGGGHIFLSSSYGQVRLTQNNAENRDKRTNIALFDELFSASKGTSRTFESIVLAVHVQHRQKP